jgi:DNA-directed RNA polymerase subunit RPC12/RpoP
MTIEADEFIWRFLIHTLPPGFQRIRHFGFLANCHRTAKLTLCRQLLAAITADNLNRCPHCGIGTMIRTGILPRYPWPAVPPADTS